MTGFGFDLHFTAPRADPFLHAEQAQPALLLVMAGRGEGPYVEPHPVVGDDDFEESILHIEND